MPARLSVELRPRAVRGDPTERVHGPGLQAAVLGAVRAVDVGGEHLAAWWHDRRGERRPYALTPLVRAGASYRFEVAVLRDHPDPAIPLPPGWAHHQLIARALHAQQRWRIGSDTFTMAGVTPLVIVTHRDLWRRAAATDRWGLNLRSSLVLREGHTALTTFPPELVFGSTLLRWSSVINAEVIALGHRTDCTRALDALHRIDGTIPRLGSLSALGPTLVQAGADPELPQPVGGLLRLQAALCTTAGFLATSVQAEEEQFERTTHRPTMDSAGFPGVTGHVWYRAAGPARSDPSRQRAISALVAFAELAGLGHLTTTGAGWARRLDAPAGAGATSASERGQAASVRNARILWRAASPSGPSSTSSR